MPTARTVPPPPTTAHRTHRPESNAMAPTCDAQTPLEERLERGEIVTLDPCPFLLPAGGDRDFLLAQRPIGRIHKDISFNPTRNVLTGFRQRSDADASRLHTIPREFGRDAAGWLV